MALILSGDTGVPASGMPTGSVIQTVTASYGTQATNGSTSYTDTGLTATITPTSSTSKILVLVNQSSIAKDGATSVNIKLLRNATDIIVFGGTMSASASSAATSASSATCSYLDSPATTSATTYKTQFAINNGSGVNAYVQWNSIGSSTITLMEIKQ
jgi:hypothetical protein